jgi:hypothetical protein
MIKLQLDVSQEFIEMLDSLAKARESKIKPMSKLEWMHKDKHGKAYMNRVLDPYGMSKGKTSEQINKEVQEEYRRCVGPAAVGRPKLAPQRVAIITEAVTKLLDEERKVAPIKQEAKKTVWR